ncbi:MAG: hypothetical protein AEth_00340 [Candidatus Argoarchaeum ethanivorans]|uniref:Uncharacterized protein n=1 Tax=Candidatus Argoarchaeum ethanivorans TaxID=2608793 RepID=A0A8B3S335_9EURY|nr:MAG: hypothetical protein AEth_00340 [Candidatus Argoarchaeum ethanivorans]
MEKIPKLARERGGAFNDFCENGSVKRERIDSSYYCLYASGQWKLFGEQRYAVDQQGKSVSNTKKKYREEVSKTLPSRRNHIRPKSKQSKTCGGSYESTESP